MGVMSKENWSFPISRCHAGLPLGNGNMGILIWGEGRHLRLTIGRNDFWDHRGGLAWSPDQKYETLVTMLKNGDEEGLRKLFEQGSEKPEGTPHRPTILPLGRIDLELPPQVELCEATLDYKTGEARISCKHKKKILTLRVALDMESPLAAVDFSELPGIPKVIPAPSWYQLEDYFRSVHVAEPRLFAEKDLCGWVQSLPEDPGMCLAARSTEKAVFIATERRESYLDSPGCAESLLEPAVGKGYGKFASKAEKWWKRYNRNIPSVSIPNKTIMRHYNLGMHKFGAMTNPAGIAAGLQGPWIEDFQLPPWSADYHFNINVQMCYWPGYRGNCLEHFMPLWSLLNSWRERLQSNARIFMGIDDGLMLPHAVDDRCTAMGGFWTGMIDHGCTAWMAQMMFQHYEYSMDTEFLRDVAWPFMVGAMRVYEEMLEERDGEMVLPVSVSPEYGGKSMDAWGANASFQLAAIHRLAEDLQKAAAILGTKSKPIWRKISEQLPRATVEPWDGPDGTRFGQSGAGECIALWEGKLLPESHRHHSHLAAIFPFKTIDPSDPDWEGTVANSIRQWIFAGMGLWTGWCVPWAAILHTYMGNADTAEFLLEVMDRFYSNEGFASVHDALYPGLTLLCNPANRQADNWWGREKMQMDAAMGAVTAVQEMLLHDRNGVHYLFAGAPEKWEDVAFENMRTRGAFLVSSRRKKGKVRKVAIKSEAGGSFRMQNCFDGDVVLEKKEAAPEILSGPILEIEIKKGETVRFKTA